MLLVLVKMWREEGVEGGQKGEKNAKLSVTTQAAISKKPQKWQCRRKILPAEVKMRLKFHLKAFHTPKHNNQATTALASNYLVSAIVQKRNYFTLSSSSSALAAVKDTLCLFTVCLYNTDITTTQNQARLSCYSDLIWINFQLNTDISNYRIKTDFFFFKQKTHHCFV